jgi:2-oxoglutarate dehydrogenase E2 component (dihydrolipoamide succinyltransferase)
MLTTFNEVNMAPVMELRKRHGEEFLKKYGVKLGFMSFFVKAAVQAMKEVPAINAQLDGEDIIENHFFDIGVAVGTDKGLMVPVVRDCDQLNFASIEKAIGDVGKRARDGKIQLPELQGGVFTISNGGIYGSMLSTPILNHPQAALMGLQHLVERPVAPVGFEVADGEKKVPCVREIDIEAGWRRPVCPADGNRRQLDRRRRLEHLARRIHQP